jgi:hypothetical protein
MRTLNRCIILAFFISVAISAQQTSFQDSLLDRMVGNWILKGTIADQEVVHDIEISWILEHQYLQIYEISREKDPDGTAVYEAMVFVGWDEKLNKYACLWLDVTGGGGLTGEGIGRGERKGDEIPFVFKMGEEYIFHTTFKYERDTDTWKWIMDGEDNGKLKPFARVVLTRKNN